MSNTKTWKTALKEAHIKFIAINPDRAISELGFAMQIFQNSEALQKCDPQSIINAVVNVARTSVTLNPVMRLAYLVPRKGKCVLDFSYMGLVAILRDNNCIKSMSAHIPYEDEDFDFDMAYNKITHRPRFAKTEEEHNLRSRIGCYSRATLPNGEVVFEFMPMWEIEKVKRLSEGSGSKYSAWQTWEEEMIKKVVIKRHFKMLISINPSEALATALQIENDNNNFINSLEEKPQNQLGVSKPSMMSIFDIEEDDEPLEPKKEIVETPAKKKKVEKIKDFTDDEINAFLQEENEKHYPTNEQQPSLPIVKAHIVDVGAGGEKGTQGVDGIEDAELLNETNERPALDLFADEDPNQYAQDTSINDDEEPEDNMSWFPTPKE
jgi:phage RecT family recombinase